LQDFQRKIINRWGKLSIFVEISLAEALQTVKHGLRIAKEVETRIPREFEEYRYILGDMDDVKVEVLCINALNAERANSQTMRLS
jgi:hypothetical protein